MVLEYLNEMQYFAKSLALGVDPTSKVEFKCDSVMMLPKVIEYNKKVCELIDLIKYGKKNRKYLIPFSMTDSEKEAINLLNDETSISNFVQYINSQVNSIKSMEKLKATQIVNGLMNMGFLKSVKDVNNKKQKIPTEKGENMGIHSIMKQNSYGNYYQVNLYNIKAQKFILLNITEILNNGVM